MADDLGLSLRQIQRGFAALGTTPTKYLLQSGWNMRAGPWMTGKQDGDRPDLVDRL
jgi:hypothetical protein